MESKLDFQQKRKSLIDCLANAEKSLVGSSLQQNTEVHSEYLSKIPSNKKRQKPVVRALRTKESIFKRPELPISKCLPVRNVPDYCKNPQKWKKYSLEGIDISDKTNSSAAFAFLKEIDQRNNPTTERLTELPSKIEFQKSVRIKNELNKMNTNKTASSTRRGIIEQDGNKRPKSTKPDSLRQSKALKLNHLFEEDEEGDE